jgi:cell division protein FtsZ
VTTRELPIIKVVGIGGGGNNFLRAMMDTESISRKPAMHNFHFIATDTDWVALEKFEKDCGDKLQHILKLGTSGTGFGGNLDSSRHAAEKSYDGIRAALSGANMVAILAGMGGGTGTGAAPIVAGVAKDLNIPVLAIVTTPFPFEGKKRVETAREGIATLRKTVDALTLIPNQALLCSLSKTMTMMDLFGLANNMAQCALWDFTYAYLVE